MASTSQFLASSLFNLSGKIGLVTGGGTGIGLMAAQALAANGGKIYVVGRRLDALERAAKSHSPSGGGSIIPLQADVNNQDDITRIVKEITSKEKELNILVCNHGISGPTRSVEEGDKGPEALSQELLKDEWSQWTSVFQTNVFSYYFLAAAFLPLLSKGTANNRAWSSSIVNIASISGITSTSQHHFAYNASKAATIQLGSLLAHEFSREQIKVRVNTICPGIFPSEMTADTSDDSQKSHIDASGYRSEKGIPAGRPGKDEDMASAVLTAACNQYMNNGQLVVDGGYLLAKP